ncbi:NAD-dependent epimerase/dehydratase family protein [Pararhodobacter sp.]|uniref:NAD-dependent epimerase/dehydratase family protein n=1 Tax=Pararhodobacter sp. TaxID=2127056 RepID=UPI002AFDF876|nr:NAD-dependent epimerase/dehydratase family protein [Pararhodobacter sp.]
MMRETILVTGSSGLIGTAVCADLERRGHVVRRFDIADQGGGYGDIRVPSALGAALDGCTGVIHLAGVSRVIWGERDPAACHATNVIGTRTVLACVRQSDLPPWVIFGSSREVYGQSPTLPVTESAPLRPMNHYARSKVQAEHEVTRAREAGVRAAILRFSTVYGSALDHADRVVPAFCQAALRGQPLRIDGETNSLDITHVTDVAACIANVATRLSEGQSLAPMHLTTGQATPLIDLARRVIQIAQSPSEVVLAEPRNFDVASFVGDPRLAMAQVGWQPVTPLNAGLHALLAQLRAANRAA